MLGIGCCDCVINRWGAQQNFYAAGGENPQMRMIGLPLPVPALVAQSHAILVSGFSPHHPKEPSIRTQSKSLNLVSQSKFHSPRLPRSFRGEGTPQSNKTLPVAFGIGWISLTTTAERPRVVPDPGTRRLSVPDPPLFFQAQRDRGDGSRYQIKYRGESTN